MGEVDLIIVGAGIGGIGTACEFARNSNLTFKVLERQASFGGTWELFKYPGIRSDSDMYSFSFSYHPWLKEQRFAPAAEIKSYLKDVVSKFGLEDHILYNQKVVSTNWSSSIKRWTSEMEDGSKWISKYIYFCTGYYDHDEGYTPDFKGVDDFKGEILHPQKWPKDADMNGKKVVVIGSGATAISVVPALCKIADVTMLQRSPTYMIPLTDKEPLWFIQRLLVSVFGDRMRRLIFKFRRWMNIFIVYVFYWWCRSCPNTVKRIYLRLLSMFLGKKEVKRNWTPKYNPWDQRVCACPEGDFQGIIKNKEAKIVTDNIVRFTTNGIALKSGDHLDADVIITATGLKLSLGGKIQISVDNIPVKPSDCYFYKGAMLSSIPNAFIMFGYTNASWTLRVETASAWACRMCNYATQNGYQVITPTDPSKRRQIKLENPIDMNSSYILRYKHLMPKTGNKSPWNLKQNYYVDSVRLAFQNFNDKELLFQ